MTTTSDARKRLAENRNTAHPAPTPTPVAAPTPALDAVLDEAEERARNQSGTCTGEHCEGCESGRRVTRARAELAALSRPEPVVAPLPSEAVDDTQRRVAYLVRKIETNLSEIEGADAGKRCVVCGHVKHNELAYCQVGQCPCSTGVSISHMAAIVLRDFRDLRRLVPEDDEGTVRVPSIADTCCGKCPGACYVDQVTGA